MSESAFFSGSVPINYDTYLGPLLFEPYAIDLTGRIKNNEPHRVLELACGTGRVTYHLLQKLPGDAKLIATDYNEDMLAVAKSKIKDDRVEWLVVDAHDIPFKNKSFDLVVCQFGVMFFEDKLKAFREINRVLKAEGYFLFNTWDNLKHNFLSNIAQDVMFEFFKEDPPLFFEKGPFSFFDIEKIKRLLKNAGYNHVSLSIVQKHSKAKNADNMIKGYLDGSPLSKYLTERNAPQQKIRERLKELILEKEGTSLPMQAIVCEAIK